MVDFRWYHYSRYCCYSVVFYPPLMVYIQIQQVYSFVNCALYTTPMCLPPPLDASAWVEIPVALVGDILAYYHYYYYYDTPAQKIPLPAALGHLAVSPCPYAVTGLAFGNMGDSY